MKKDLIKIKIIEQFDNLKKGGIHFCSKKDAEAFVKEGIAEYVKEEKTKIKVKKVNKKNLVLTKKQIKKKLIESFELIKEVIKEYSDIKKEYLPLIASWIIGTYMHDEFESYPYLFINAMRGSGKTRLLKLIAALSYNGEVTSSLSESVLFRTGKGRTLCIDEFEGLGKKDNSNLRELLNAAYKKGSTVKRMKKQKSLSGEEYVVEEFEVYSPIVMANIWGMEEVLGDRCISLNLERSNKPYITKLIENFSENTLITLAKNNLLHIKCSLCSVVTVKNMYIAWNNYVKDKYLKTTLTTYNTYNNNNYINYIDFFNDIDETNIDGRNLELSFPLFVIMKFIGNEQLKNLLNTIKDLMKEKRNEEFFESRDVTFIDFISKIKEKGFISVKHLSNLFKDFLKDDEEFDDKWVNSKWVGRALKRLSLSKEKRRVSSGVEVLLNLKKAQEKIKMFTIEQ